MAEFDLFVMVANLRVSTAPDRLIFQWGRGRRKQRAVKALRRHNPDVILAQECDEVMTPYVAEKLGMAVVKPTDGNRPIFYRADVLRLIDKAATDVGGRSFCHAALLEGAGARAWYVSLHLSTSDTERKRQLVKLEAWLSDLAKICPNVVVGGDFNQDPVRLWGFADARTMVPAVGNRMANSLHGWRTQKWDGKWIDWLFVRPVEGSTRIEVRFVDLLLTSSEGEKDQDPSDHNWIGAGIRVITSALDPR